MKTLTQSFKAARRSGVPIVAVETADQQGSVRTIVSIANGNIPAIQWDAIRGLTSLNSLGDTVINKVIGQSDPSSFTNPSEMLAGILNVPKDTVVFFHNAHRFISLEYVSQGICNVRDVFEGRGATMVLLAPAITLPQELSHDVIIMNEELPDSARLQEIVGEVKNDAELKLNEKREESVPKLEVENMKDLKKVADVLIGLSGFEARQTLATCIGKLDNDNVGLDTRELWEKKCRAIEQTPGLSYYRGLETYADIGGINNIKFFMKSILDGKDSPLVIVFMDEIEKMLAGVGTDTSGVSTEMLGLILRWMEDNQIEGMIAIGPPGAAKSAFAKATGNEGGIPTIIFDVGAAKNSLVGKSGEQLREDFRVINAVGQNRVVVIATCNSIGVLPPELKRRFTLGTFFFDLPTKEERDVIWPIYEKKYNVTGEHPEDTDWTGAEIKQCCKLASKLGISLIKAAMYIVPVAISSADSIENLRRQATGKFISASTDGVYTPPKKQQETGRVIREV